MGQFPCRAGCGLAGYRALMPDAYSQLPLRFNTRDTRDPPTAQSTVHCSPDWLPRRVEDKLAARYLLSGYRSNTYWLVGIFNVFDKTWRSIVLANKYIFWVFNLPLDS